MDLSPYSLSLSFVLRSYETASLKYNTNYFIITCNVNILRMLKKVYIFYDVYCSVFLVCMTHEYRFYTVPVGIRMTGGGEGPL